MSLGLHRDAAAHWLFALGSNANCTAMLCAHRQILTSLCLSFPICRMEDLEWPPHGIMKIGRVVRNGVWHIVLLLYCFII